MPRQYTPRVEITCKACSKIYFAQPAQIKKNRQFCSRECYRKSLPKEGNPRWLGGRSKHSRGYIFITTPDGRRMQEHRYVMELAVDRRLEYYEQVRHVNRNTSDNRIENLQLVTTAEHAQLHRPQQWSKHFTECVDCGRTDRKHASNGYCYTCYKRLKRK